MRTSQLGSNKVVTVLATYPHERPQPVNDGTEILRSLELVLIEMDIEAFAAQNGVDMGQIPHLLSGLALHAYQRYVQSGKTDDISEAVDLAKLGIHRANDRNPLFTQWLSNLGVFLFTRYERTGELGDLEEAIETVRQTIESTPDDHSD